MYVGDYLSTNLGHEIINMFQADNGEHYLYLNATGNFGKVHNGQIGYMLLVKYHSEGAIEVIGMATGLSDVPGANMSPKKDQIYNGVDKDIWGKQNKYINNEVYEQKGLTYGGVPILKIFNDAEQQSIFITYKAKKLYKPTKPIFICYGENVDINCEEECVKICLNGYNQALTSLKTYMYPDGFYKGQEKINFDKKRDDYKKISASILDLSKLEVKSLWKEFNCKVGSEILAGKSRDVSLFDICQIQNDENAFSNALAHFMRQSEYQDLWKCFFETAKYFYVDDRNKKYQLKIKNLSDLKVSREENINKDSNSKKGRIDLVIRDDNNIVVIENKIKSDINKVNGDKNNSTQLRRYYDYVQKLIDKNGEKDEENLDIGKKPHYIILTPDYNIPMIEVEKDDNGRELGTQMRTEYKIITYSELYNFLKDKKSIFENDGNFVAFFEAMHRHTHENVNDYLYYDMLEKFVRRIKEANNSSSKVVSRTDPNNPNQGIVRPEDCQLPEGFEPLTGDIIYDEKLGEAIRKSEGY